MGAATPLSWFANMLRYLTRQGMGRALRHRDYAIFALSDWIAALGMWARRIAVGWLTWQLTESGTWLGLMAAAEAIPLVVLVPLTGAMADRFDRLKIFRYGQVVHTLLAMSLAGAAFAGLITPMLMLIIVFVMGVTNCAITPVRMSLAGVMVPREDIPAAVGLNSILFQISTVVGPAIAGLILAHAGAEYAFVCHSAASLWLLGALFTVRLVAHEHSLPGSGRASLWGDMVEGIRYAAHHPAIGPLLMLIMAAAVSTRPYMDLLPGFADAIFERGASGLATLVSGAGVGGIIAGIGLAQFGRIRGMTMIVMVALLASVVLLLLFSITDHFWLAVFWVAGIAATAVITSTGSQMLIQHTVDGSMRGRVMSLYGLTWRGAPAVGVLIMGWASSHFGLQAPVAAGALICFGFWLLVQPRRRRLAAALEAADPRDS